MIAAQLNQLSKAIEPHKVALASFFSKAAPSPSFLALSPITGSWRLGYSDTIF